MKKFVPKYLFIFVIRFYRFCVSPFFPACCRFYPTCSSFAIETINEFGVVLGGWMALKRLFRCHPFGGPAGYDSLP